ncbi:hypothetical protein [Bradyrhizobium lablabi]|uniref:hypothetical protein n=1 Tax=Bradyrhizobium lablabi TaxID=722472 RepID=UPI001BA90082|nr:hypothetical protein [Bradyrhizobium lablabi]MBR0692071.1 hypothetical protein [Bradyrhizobium lablabi]
MVDDVRLRQICLVAPQLEPVISDISAIMGLSVCYRDGNVAKYGLENALLPVDTILLEVVAPFKRGTAAGRFVEKTGGRGGYMAIFCCEDPGARGARANAMGVRTANVITHTPYHGVQLHPRDCRAAFIEFNHTEGSDDILGPYPPAGPDWQKSIRKDTTLALTEVEMKSPDPLALAEHWGRIIGVPAEGEAMLRLPNSVFRFVKGDSEIMSGLTFEVADKTKVLNAARARGCAVVGDEFFLCGVTFKLTT